MDPFIGEICIFGFNFAPKGWALCNGQLLPISQNTALFSLLGTTYGGDGRSTFALPNLQARAPLAPGQAAGLSAYSLGQTGGTTTSTLDVSQIASHTHAAQGSTSNGTAHTPQDGVWAQANVLRQGQKLYAAAATTPVAMDVHTLAATGGGNPHNNMQPYLVLNFCIALQGVYPPRP